MRVLVACEFSGVVCRAFVEKGHDAYSCDFFPPLPTHIDKKRHIRGDVTPLLQDEWDLVIAHPPCTYLCNSGVRWLIGNKERYGQMIFACQFFNYCLQANAPMVCVENPIPHKYALDRISPYDQLIQPWQFGHPETKATCLWLKGLPQLVPTNIVEGRAHRIHSGVVGPGVRRGQAKSITYSGIAAAMADQWGTL